MSDPVDPVTTDPTTDSPADAPDKGTEQKAMDLAKKHGIIGKVKKMIYKKLGLTPKH